MKTFAFALSAVAALAWTGSEAAAFGRRAGTSGTCGCCQPVAAPVVYAAPQPACCGVPAAPGFVPHTAAPTTPAPLVMPAPRPAPAPGHQGHEHGAAAPAPGLLFVSADAPAPAGKEVRLTGTLVCAKCKLKLDGVKACTNALQVKEGEKTVTYLLDDKGMEEEYHECGKGEKPGVTVTGSVAEKDGKKWVKPTKVEYAKK